MAAGGDASAANQLSQITIETAIRDRLPITLGPKTGANSLSIAPASDAAFAIGSLPALPAGSNVIGSVTLSGTLPAFAATPTVNLGTLGGAATAANQATTNASLATIDGKLGGTLAVDTVIRLTAADRGAIVTTAGTAQQLMAANASRRGFAIQNQSTGACYINGLASATQDYRSLLIPAGGFYDTPPTHVGTGAISIVCAVANAPVYAREW